MRSSAPALAARNPSAMPASGHTGTTCARVPPVSQCDRPGNHADTGDMAALPRWLCNRAVQELPPPTQWYTCADRGTSWLPW